MCKALQKLARLPPSRTYVQSIETWCSVSLYRQNIQYQVEQPACFCWKFFAEKKLEGNTIIMFTASSDTHFAAHSQSASAIEHSPLSEANSFSASQDISCILRNPKNRYQIQNTPRLIPTPSQFNPVHVLPSCFIISNFNINLPPTSRCPPVSFPAPLLSSLTCYMLVPFYSSL
jgi:hypothetical protein